MSWGLSDRIIAALDDQTFAVAADKRTALGRSLNFDRLTSALTVLYTFKALDDVIAQTSLPSPECRPPRSAASGPASPPNKTVKSSAYPKNSYKI